VRRPLRSRRRSRRAERSRRREARTPGEDANPLGRLAAGNERVRAARPVPGLLTDRNRVARPQAVVAKRRDAAPCVGNERHARLFPSAVVTPLVPSTETASVDVAGGGFLSLRATAFRRATLLCRRRGASLHAVLQRVHAGLLCAVGAAINPFVVLH